MKEWIDPHDMNTNAKEKYIKPRQSDLKRSSSYTSGTYPSQTDPAVYISSLRRIVSLTLNAASFNKRDPKLYIGSINFKIDPDDLDFLTMFSKDEVTLDKLRRLDAILTESFQRSYFQDTWDIFEQYQFNSIYSAITNVNIWLFIGALYMLYVIYQLCRNGFSVGYIIKYLIVVLLVYDFVLRYNSLVEEAEEHNAKLSYSSQCDSTKMSWKEYTAFLFSSRNCERKTVTPLDAFLHQTKNLIIVPLTALGTGFGAFGKEMFVKLPWGLNLILWPLMLVFVIIIFIFLMAFCTGSYIEFNIFHLLKLKFGSTNSSRHENTLTGPTVERLISGLSHRPLIQQVSTAEDSNEPKRRKAEKKVGSINEPSTSSRKNKCLNQNKNKTKVELSDVRIREEITVSTETSDVQVETSKKNDQTQKRKNKIEIETIDDNEVLKKNN